MALLARLLHDDTLELSDRVAGTLLLCYGQQLFRIAVMTIEQVHRHDDAVSVRFGAHDLTVPDPLSGLLTELIDVGRSHRGVGSPATSPWLFPGTYLDDPSPRHGSANAYEPSAFEPPRPTRHPAPTRRRGPRRGARRNPPHFRNSHPMDP